MQATATASSVHRSHQGRGKRRLPMLSAACPSSCGAGSTGRRRFRFASQPGRRTPKSSLTRCKAVYSSSRGTQFTIVELSKSEDLSVEEYLLDAERIVAVTFPDASRRKQLEQGKWEVTLLQQNFFGVEFQPSAVLKVYNENGELRIQVSELDLSDLPTEISGVPAKLLVEGSMAPRRKTQSSRIVKLEGSVKISLDVDVPPPYSTFPLLKETIELILSGVVERLEGSLKQNLPRDYSMWTREQRVVV